MRDGGGRRGEEEDGGGGSVLGFVISTVSLMRLCLFWFSLGDGACFTCAECTNKTAAAVNPGQG